jgi:predicted anti-sigma-YlaC factor YlaD
VSSGTTILDCAAARRLVCDYIDHELPVDEARALEQHVAACPSCPTLYTALVAVKGELERLQLDTMPDVDAEDLRRTVLGCLESRGEAGHGTSRGRRLWERLERLARRRR